MADGSALPYEQNVELVRARRRAGAGSRRRRRGGARRHQRRRGRRPGRGRRGADRPRPGAGVHGAYRAQTCLAVSIGNVHGIYRDPPLLDWDAARRDPRGRRRAALAARRLGHPRRGHPARDRGGHGQGQRQHRPARGLSRGDARRRSASVLEGSRLGALHAAQTDAVAEIAGAKLRAFDTGGSR